MPELPEVEVLVRHLSPLVRGRKVHSIEVHRAKVLASTSVAKFRRALIGATFIELSRRGKYLLFQLRSPHKPGRMLVGHLGMTGRMYLSCAKAPLPKHAAVVLNLGRENFVFEDIRCFGRLTLETCGVAKLGPEPLGNDFTVAAFSLALKRSSQAIKIKLLDQTIVAGIGNIYASEALFRAGISPRTVARRLQSAQILRLWYAIRETLSEAIDCGSTVPLNYAGNGKREGLFYFGRAIGAPDYYDERLRVYDRQGKSCVNCDAKIKRVVQGARSTFYCPKCQPSKLAKIKTKSFDDREIGL